MNKSVTVLDKIYTRVAQEMGLSAKDIKTIYEAYWLYIKTQIQSLPLKKSISEEEFNKLQLNYRIQGLGTLFCKVDYNKLKKIKGYIKNVTHKNNKTSI